MSWKKIYAVIRREYIERVRTKAFWIGTLLVPIFFLGYIADPDRLVQEGRRRAHARRRGHDWPPLRAARRRT